MKTAETWVWEASEATKIYRWEYAPLIGRKIVDVRAMFPEEMDLFDWSGELGAVLTLDDGTMFIPMRDPEGNAPGTLMVQKGGE